MNRRCLVLLYCSLIASLSNVSALVVGWGDNSYGQISVPAGLSNTVAVAAGYSHSLALQSDGTVVGWGDDSNGQTNAPPDLTNAVAIAAGYHYSLAVKSDGTVVGWGDDGWGQTDVPSDLTNAVDVAAGGGGNADGVGTYTIPFSLALKSDGTVVGWGNDGYGQTDVPSDLTNVVAIAAGGLHSLALRADGTVAAWGNGEGINVPPGLTNVVAITAGNNYSLALKSDRTVVVWGITNFNNNMGSPISLLPPAGLSNVAAVAAAKFSFSFNVALKSNGTVVVWGDTTALISYPTLASILPPAGLSNVVKIAAGNFHCLALGPSLVYGPKVLALVPVNSTNAAIGGMATFSVSADSTAPITYQWLFNGAPIAGATNTSVTLSNIQLSAAGNYSVHLSNALGQVTSGTFKLQVNPPNDMFANRQLIPGGGGRTIGSSVGATKEPGEPNHAGNIGGASVWYAWQSPITGDVTIDTIGSTFDTLLAVYTGDNVAALTLVAADDDGANFNNNSKLTFVATAGTTYAIAVDGYSYYGGLLGAAGGVVLNITPSMSLGNMGREVTGEVQFIVAGPAQGRAIVQWSSDLSTWFPLATNLIPAAGTVLFTDAQAASQPKRFYRALLQ